MMTVRQFQDAPPVVPASRASMWLRLSVSFAVALAFADASIAVLALPQIVIRLHTSISHVVWVIIAYNLALIAGSLAVLPFARRLGSKWALLAGLAVFGLASLGSGAADSLRVLIAMRCLQGLGGALLLCASLPLFLGSTRSSESSLAGWATAAAVGAAIGPAAGGLLTEVFDWRAIFLAQAPFAVLAGLAVMVTYASRSREPTEARGGTQALDSSTAAGFDRARLHPATANASLTFISAGLIGALFLVTILLINVWLLTPLGAAVIVSVIPLATAGTARLTRGMPAAKLSAIGAVVLAAGLGALALVSHRELGWVVLALSLCGIGLGMSFPALTRAALNSAGNPAARAARTVAARDAGLVLGLLILTPVFVHELNVAPNRAVPSIARAVFAAPIPISLKFQLSARLLAANARAPQSELPDIGPPFASLIAGADAQTKVQLSALKVRVGALIERAATRSFRRPLVYCALFALLVIPLLLLRLDRFIPQRR